MRITVNASGIGAVSGDSAGAEAGGANRGRFVARKLCLWWASGPGRSCARRKSQEPRAKSQVPSAKCQVPSAKCQVPSGRYRASAMYPTRTCPHRFAKRCGRSARSAAGAVCRDWPISDLIGPVKSQEPNYKSQMGSNASRGRKPWERRHPCRPRRRMGIVGVGGRASREGLWRDHPKPRSAVFRILTRNSEILNSPNIRPNRTNMNESSHVCAATEAAKRLAVRGAPVRRRWRLARTLGSPTRQPLRLMLAAARTLRAAFGSLSRCSAPIRHLGPPMTRPPKSDQIGPK